MRGELARLPANGLPQRVRPSSVIFGDSFPRWGSLFVQQIAPDRTVRGVLPVMLVEEVLVEGDTEVVGDGAQVIVGDGLADQAAAHGQDLDVDLGTLFNRVG